MAKKGSEAGEPSFGGRGIKPKGAVIRSLDEPSEWGIKAPKLKDKIDEMSSTKVPRVELLDELFANIGTAVGAQLNKFLGSLQDVSCGRNLKQFLLVITGFFAAAIIGSWCNLLTVFYIGFVCSHTLPVLYERHRDQVDEFLYNTFGLLQNQYQKLDKGVLSKVPKGIIKLKKSD
ncbi:hypothetical protein GUJ93_ZPchr0013g37640 [Zizania palustris]|uniref:Reticulon-like protein n=1 Tax=Zizania palustris TaxID=103762 RepID=A0A8J6C2M9_ZIZPA|nr:hypothetical protein GUJ93_ZPchr0013g37640 [Zizania palustris]